ncbi:MAG: acyl-CoA dehydrogenase family protein [Syntrophales bacterium]|nr:acyl-CoA dehydrogenase family protein [Syntrophales bacterium]
MDFNFNEDQRILTDMARKFFEKEAPKSLVRELLHDSKGYSPELWQKMGELGWMGLAFDEEYGGYGGSFLEVAIIFEETGRAGVPTPLFSTVVLSGLLLQDSGSAELKRKYLTKIAKGDCISTLALVGKAGIYSKGEVGLEAKPVGDHYHINGTASFVPYAHVADNIICAARTPLASGEGVTLFVVDGKAEGLEIIPLKTISGEGVDCVVNMRDVKVTIEQIVGEPGKGWECIERLWPKIAVALSCECVGGMKKVMELTIAHVNGRVQFGKPLAALQIVQHMCAEMFIKSETSRHAAYHAAWLISEGLECEKEAAIAKSWCGEAFKDLTKIAHQLTGGIGFTEEFDLHLYTRNAKKLELLFGDGAFHRNVVAGSVGL